MIKRGRVGTIAGIVSSLITVPLATVMYVMLKDYLWDSPLWVYILVDFIFNAPVMLVGGFLGGIVGGAVGSRRDPNLEVLGARIGGVLLGGIPILVFFLVIP